MINDQSNNWIWHEVLFARFNEQRGLIYESEVLLRLVLQYCSTPCNIKFLLWRVHYSTGGVEVHWPDMERLLDALFKPEIWYVGWSMMGSKNRVDWWFKGRFCGECMLDVGLKNGLGLVQWSFKAILRLYLGDCDTIPLKEKSNNRSYNNHQKKICP